MQNIITKVSKFCILYENLAYFAKLGEFSENIATFGKFFN